jgi:hypothetical protein
MKKRFIENNKNLKVSNPFRILKDLNVDVDQSRYVDFMNYAANKLSGADNQYVPDSQLNYSFFGADTDSKKSKVNELRDMEIDFLKSVDFLQYDRKDLKSLAAFLAAEFENSFKEGNKPQHDAEKLKNFMSSKKEGGDTQVDIKDFILSKDIKYLETLALLSKKKAFSKKIGKLEENPSGNIIRYKPMTSISDVANIDLLSHVEPTFIKKLACEEYYKKTRFNKSDKSQNLIILVDDSGSMSDHPKPSKLQAAINLKLRNTSSNSNIYVGTFETNVYGFEKVTNSNVFSDLKKIILNKSGTDVCGCIKDTLKMVRKRKLLKYDGSFYDLSDNSFEILLINDGDDHIDTQYHPGIKIHIISLDNDNNDLRNLALKSSGTYLTL